MDNTPNAVTFPRHGHLVTGFFPNVWEMFKKKELYHLQEEQILAFNGKKYSGEEQLIDITLLDEIDKTRLVRSGIDTLDFVQPDFLYFKNNVFLQSTNLLRTIGVPDLIIEVWSDNNYEHERDMKFRLYSSSPKCEHWYLSQDSNIVQCYIGRQELIPQSLKNILVTLDNIAFDLRHLAL